MIQRVLLLALTLSLVHKVSSQCLTDFFKLVPDQTPTYTEAFGYIVSVYKDILAVGAPSSDSLGLPNAGLIYLYQKSGTQWDLIGVLKPSNPTAQARFGGRLAVTENYIMTTANTGFYIYRKPETGWQTTTETLILKPDDASSLFGTHFSLSEDEQTLVVADINYAAPAGAFYVFHKEPDEEWNNSLTPQVVINPDIDNNIRSFGVDVQMIENKIACATLTVLNGGPGTVYIYDDDSGNFNNFQLEARMTVSPGTTGGAGFGSSLVFTREGIFRYLSGKIVYYQPPSSGTWEDSQPTCEYTLGLIDNLEMDYFYVNYTAAADALYFTMKLKDESGRLLKLQKQGADWCGPLNLEILHTEPPPVEGGSTLFVRSLSCFEGTEIALSWTSSAASRTAVAVGAFSAQPDNSWTKQFLLKSNLSATDFQLGRSLWHTDGFLFSGARQERTLDRDPRGAVYIYQKQGPDWIKVNKLFELPVNASDQRYGSSLTGHGNYLAVAAYGYTPDKIFIYEGNNGDFTTPQLIQTLHLPTGKSVDSYGNMVMNENFLIVPAATNPPSGTANVLMFFKKDAGNQWTYVYDLVLGPVNVIFKRPPSVDIDGDILLASDGYQKVFVIEYNPAKDHWEIKNTLTASDPDKDPFFGATIDGSYFGNAVKLNGDKIFIGAPGKNFNGINDVGAIYVYARQQGAWHSGTERTKLLPAEKTTDLYFGASIDVLENTLITGGPSLTQPGKVFVIQSKDYFWLETIQLLYLEGDTFTNDYYGYHVALSEDDFFISAPLENNSAGLAAGTIYVTLPPPIVKLVPPVCHSQSAFNLFGYPFDGTWSGSGITDGNTGLFDPALAGIGLHELTYVTLKCFYEGKLLLDIKPQPSASPGSALNHVACLAGKTSVTLSVQEVPEVVYVWDYAPYETSPFTRLEENSNSLIVNSTDPGVYRATVSNNYCANDITFTVGVEMLEIEIHPFDEVCDASKQTLDLVANVTGGTWQLNGAPSLLIDQAGQTIDISPLGNGNYLVHYQYVSSEQCLYNSTRALTIDRIIEPAFNVTDHQCKTGAIQVEASFDQPENQFSWYYLPTAQADTVLLNEPGTVLAITQAGYYGMIINRGSCRMVLSPLFIDYQPLDEIFIPNVFTPDNGDDFNERFRAISSFASVTFQVFNRYGKLVFSGDGITGWDGGDSPSGIYYWIATATDCTNQLKTFKGWVHLIK